MPLITTILAVALLVFLFQGFTSMRQNTQKRQEQDQRAQALQEQLQAVQNQLAQLEKRLGNVEAIVTDSQFVDPPTNGREAIDLQAEIRAIKDQLNRR